MGQIQKENPFRNLSGRPSIIYRLAKKYGIVEEHDKDIQFYFEKEEER